MGVGTDFSTRKQREDEQREKELARIRRYPKVCDVILPTFLLNGTMSADALGNSYRPSFASASMTATR